MCVTSEGTSCGDGDLYWPDAPLLGVLGLRLLLWGMCAVRRVCRRHVPGAQIRRSGGTMPNGDMFFSALWPLLGIGVRAALVMGSGPVVLAALRIAARAFLHRHTGMVLLAWVTGIAGSAVSSVGVAGLSFYGSASMLKGGYAGSPSIWYFLQSRAALIALVIAAGVPVALLLRSSGSGNGRSAVPRKAALRPEGETLVVRQLARGDCRHCTMLFCAAGLTVSRSACLPSRYYITRRTFGRSRLSSEIRG
jgi:hypothetical protein